MDEIKLFRLEEDGIVLKLEEGMVLFHVLQKLNQTYLDQQSLFQAPLMYSEEEG